MFRGRPAPVREGVRAARGVPAGCGGVSACGRPGGKALAYFFLEIVSLEMAQGKGAEGTLRLEPGLQAGPEEGGEDDVEMKVQFGLGAGLAVLEAQVLLGIAEGKLDLETGAVEPKDAFRCQLGIGAVQEHALRRLRVGPAGQDVDHLQPALPGLAVQDRVIQVDLLVGQGCAGQARRVAAVEAAVELAAAARTAFVGAGVGEAQDRVLAQPPHRVQVQGPHTFHEGPAGVATVGGHPARAEDRPGPGHHRLPQQGQPRLDSRFPTGGGPARLPTRADGARRLPGTEGIGTAFLDIHGRQQRDLQPPAHGAGHATPKPARAPGPATTLGHEAGIQDQQRSQPLRYPRVHRPQRGHGQAREGEGPRIPARMGARRPAAVVLETGEV